MSKGRNDWLIDLIESAERRGWMVLDLDMRVPGSVTLADVHGTEIRISDRYGINLKIYVEQLTAIPRQEPTEVAA